MNKFFNIIYIITIFLLIGTIIRTLIYILIGLPQERIFRIELIIFWCVSIAMIIYRYVASKSLKKNK